MGEIDRTGSGRRYVPADEGPICDADTKEARTTISSYRDARVDSIDVPVFEVSSSENMSVEDERSLSIVSISQDEKLSETEHTMMPSRSAPALRASLHEHDDDEDGDQMSDLHHGDSHANESTGLLADRVTMARSATSKNTFDLSQNLTPVFTTDVLTDPLTLKMISRYSDHHKIPNGVDLIRFWVEIDELQHLPSHSYTHRRLRKIYDKFLSPEAPSPVCVTGQMLQEIERALESDNISAGMYADAQSVCFIALEKSVFPRFRENKLFKKMQEFCAPAIPAASSGGNGGSSVMGAISVGRNNAESPTVTNDLDEDYSLMGVLNHPAKLRFLKTFCMEALALENLLFYLEVEDCKRLPNLSFITNKTRKIYDRYCTPSSKNYIRGIDGGGALRDLHQAVETKAPLLPKLFYEAQLLAFDRISEDIWRGFCRTQEYLQHSKDLRTEKKAPVGRQRPNRGSGGAASALASSATASSSGPDVSGSSGGSDQNAQIKLDSLSEVQLIEAAMHYPVEKLIPIKYVSPPNDRQSLAVFLLAAGHGGDSEFMSPQEQLATVLSDPYAKKYFKQFMHKRGVDQLLAFCEEVEDFKLLPGIEYLQHSAKKIYRKYMMPSARLQVDMSTAMRDEIYMRLANPSVDMFKKIAARVRHGMLQDSLLRFVKSQPYSDLKREISKSGTNSGVEQELKSVDAAAKTGKLELVHLDVFLLNQVCMRAFRGFLESQHCSENLMLWEEIEHFKRLPSYQIVLRSARKIYDKYLNPNNPRMVIPLSDALRARVTDQLDVASRTTFDEVENECFDVMRNIVLPDFLDSRIFMALVGTWATVDDDYPADMLRGEFEMAFLRHRFHLVQEARGLSRDASTPLLERVRASGGMGS